MAAAQFDEAIFAEIRFERDRKAPPPGGFPSLPEIPGGRYTRRDFFDLEIEHVFRKSWVMAGIEDELPNAGSYKRFSKLPGAPLLLMRGRDGVIRAFFNTCRHRGAPVVHDQTGRCNVLRCQYHSWAYDFDGRLVQVPDEFDFPGLDKSARGLLRARCETWRGLIFVNLDLDAPSLLDWMGPLADEWAYALPEGSRFDYHWSRQMGCNWKCALDAFQEVYHINTLHPQTVGAMLEHHAAAMALLPHGHSRMCVRYSGADIDTPPQGWPAGEIFQRTSVAHTLWPALNVPWSPRSGKLMNFWPIAPGRCEIEVYGMGPSWGEGPMPEDRLAGNVRFDSILEEDVSNLEAIQASLESGAFTGMMLGYPERRIYWSHEEIDRAIGPARVPPELAVKQILAPFVEQPVALAAE
jgi:phenylpropionate dioxygenase-like ring-hydroxylating dioxygenase large terminal subunit